MLSALRSSWHAARRVARSGVPSGTGKLAFKGGESIDDVGGFEGSVAAAHVDLLQGARVGESRYGIVGRLERPSDEGSGGVDGDNGGSGQCAEQTIGS